MGFVTGVPRNVKTKAASSGRFEFGSFLFASHLPLLSFSYPHEALAVVNNARIQICFVVTVRSL